jgi:hypothetical protein
MKRIKHHFQDYAACYFVAALFLIPALARAGMVLCRNQWRGF